MRYYGPTALLLAEEAWPMLPGQNFLAIVNYDPDRVLEFLLLVVASLLRVIRLPAA